jgi:prophage regulatory protein
MYDWADAICHRSVRVTDPAIPPKIERLPAVMARTGLKKSAIYAAAARGDFPKPVKLIGGRASGFISSQIDAWILAKAAGSSTVNVK